MVNRNLSWTLSIDCWHASASWIRVRAWIVPKHTSRMFGVMINTGPRKNQASITAEIERWHPTQLRFHHPQREYSRLKRWSIPGSHYHLRMLWYERWEDEDIWRAKVKTPTIPCWRLRKNTGSDQVMGMVAKSTTRQINFKRGVQRNNMTTFTIDSSATSSSEKR